MSLINAQRPWASLQGDVLRDFAPDGFSGSVAQDGGHDSGGYSGPVTGGAGFPPGGLMPRDWDGGVPSQEPVEPDPTDPENDPEAEDPTTGDFPRVKTPLEIIRDIEAMIAKFKARAEEEKEDGEEETTGSDTGHTGGDKGGESDSIPTETAPHTD